MTTDFLIALIPSAVCSRLRFAVSNVLRFNASNIDLPACFSEVSVPDRLHYLSFVYSRVQGVQRHQAL